MRRTVSGNPSSEFTFFPGYSWRAAKCEQCGAHLGWLFERVSPYSRTAAAAATTTPQARHASRSTASGGTRTFAKHSSAWSSSSSASSSSSSGDATAAAAPETVEVRPHRDEEERALLAPLESTCLPLSQGYWTFEFCHRREVRQYHRDGTKLDPNWSLGSFDERGRVERAIPPATLGRHYYTSHFFVDGQRCDETRRGRSTEVQFFCCPSLPAQAIAQAQAHASATGADPASDDELQRIDAILVSVEEPQLCKYRMQVCVRSLCIPTDSPASISGVTEPPPPSSSSATTAAASSSSSSSSPPEPEPDAVPTTDDAVPAATTTSGLQQEGGDRPRPARFFAFLWDAVIGDRAREFRWIDAVDAASGLSLYV